MGSHHAFGSHVLIFFGFLHAGEAEVPDYSDFNPTQNLTYADIAIDSMSKSTYLQVNKSSQRPAHSNWMSES